MSSMAKANVETEIKLRLSALPREILFLESASSVKILQTYYKPNDEKVISTVKDVLSSHLSADQITDVLSAASEIRTRASLDKKNTTKYKLTIKTDGGLSRGETEVPISASQYDTFHTSGAFIGSIHKTRHTVEAKIEIKTVNPSCETSCETSCGDTSTSPHTFMLEIDHYEENLTGLVTAEVEFDPKLFTYADVIDAVTGFITENTTESVSIVDVTLDKTFKNKNLAIKQSFSS